MEKLKTAGGVLLGIVVFVAAIIALVLLISLGAGVAFAIKPWIDGVAGTLLVINLLILPFAIIPSSWRGIGLWYYWTSYIYGAATWLLGLAITLSLWGFFALILGLLLAGVGVVPIGLLAAGFTGHWDLFWSLAFSLILTYGMRLAGIGLQATAEKRDEKHTLRRRDAIEATITRVEERKWSDME